MNKNFVNEEMTKINKMPTFICLKHCNLFSLHIFFFHRLRLSLKSVEFKINKLFVNDTQNWRFTADFLHLYACVDESSHNINRFQNHTSNECNLMESFLAL